MTFHLFLNVSISGHILDLMAPAMRNNSLAEQVESRRRFGPQNLAEPHKSTPRFLSALVERAVNGWVTAN